MGDGIFFGGSVIAAFLAGGVALFAPCCISVMLPAYVASAFQNRRALVAMTLLFAAGIATIILPIALGAAAIQRFIVGQHPVVYTIIGLTLLALAAYTLLGGRLHLPMPGARAGGKAGPLSVYLLGVFSGTASSCCAPVLAGVVALSGVAGSFGRALGLGTAFVFGMVAPLFVLSLMWERLAERRDGLFRPRTLTWRIGGLSRTISVSALASGILLVLMGAATLVVGLTSDSMPNPSGWQARFGAQLQHNAAVLTKDLSGVPGIVAVLSLATAAALLVRRALRETAGHDPDNLSPSPLTDEPDAVDPDHQEQHEREYA